MYQEKRVVVILPAFNEKENIVSAINDFKPFVDRILVIDNNSTDNTNALADEAGAKVIKESKQGYGAALTRGLMESKEDLIVMCEPDGTFQARDLNFLLGYTMYYDCVFGTRTKKEFISEGANMGWFLYYGNKFVAKLLSIKYGGYSFTDVGCTFKIIKKDALMKVLPNLKVNGSWFSPHFMMECIKQDLSIVETPVHYGPRTGTSKITGSKWKAFKLGMKMIWEILR